MIVIILKVNFFVCSYHWEDIVDLWTIIFRFKENFIAVWQWIELCSHRIQQIILTFNVKVKIAKTGIKLEQFPHECFVGNNFLRPLRKINIFMITKLKKNYGQSLIMK